MNRRFVKYCISLYEHPGAALKFWLKGSGVGVLIRRRVLNQCLHASCLGLKSELKKLGQKLSLETSNLVSKRYMYLLSINDKNIWLEYPVTLRENIS